MVRREPLHREQVAVLATLALLTVIAWAVTIAQMSGMAEMGGSTASAPASMDMGRPAGQEPGVRLAVYLGMWVSMMAAMMLPAAAPMILMFGTVYRQKRDRGAAFVPTWVFVAGYLAAWTAYGLLGFGIYRGVSALDLGFLAWDEQGPIVAGAAVAVAGLYQLTPLKEICLRHCRSPMHFLLHGWHEGRLGALRMGVEHGLYCVGCCWGLMLVLIALGVMSLFWMAVVAAVIFAEKVLPFGARLHRPLAVLLVGLGIWVAAAPSTVPGLTQPGTMTKMQEMKP